MKKMKRLAALFLAVVMVMAMGMTAMAADVEIKGALDGATYKAYKIFNVKTATEKNDKDEDVVVGYTYTRPIYKDEEKTVKNVQLSTEEGYFTVTTGSSDVYYTPDKNLTGSSLAEYLGKLDLNAFALEDVKEAKTGANNVANFTGLSDGYYYIISDQGNVAMLRAIDGTTTITEKKTESGWGDNGGKQSGKLTVSGNDMVLVPDTFYAIGDTINYEVTYEKAYNYVTGADGKTEKVIVYNAKDSMPDGLKLDPDSVEVTVIESNNTKHKDVPYTGKPTEKGFDIAIKWAETDEVGVEDFVYENVPAVIKINYRAEVTSEVNAGSPIVNKAYINYNGKNTDPGKDDTVYTGAVTIRKFDGEKETKNWDDATTKLAATFKIYKIENNKRLFLIQSNGKISWTDPVDKGTVPANASDFTTSSEGTLYVKGLDSGTYYLLETVAPEGYNALLDNDGATFTIAKNGSTAAADLVVNADVPNEKGTVLPSTGGIGTTIFYVVGGIMVLGAGVLLITKKRMSAK